MSEARVALITGGMGGLGTAVCRRLHKSGFQVAATYSPGNDHAQAWIEAQKDEGYRFSAYKLDVGNYADCEWAVEKVRSDLGRIDVLVNNAGYGLTGTFESMTLDQIRRQFDTNVFGLMEVTRQLLPHFRANQAGTVVNVASMGGRLTFPLYSVYHATKWAVDGFSESLQFELRPLGIRVKIVEPGAIKTDFYDRSAVVAHNRTLGEYNTLVDKATRRMNAAGDKGASPEIVARAIYRAATDSGWKLRYPVGADAKSMLTLRRFLPDAAYQAMIRQALLG